MCLYMLVWASHYFITMNNTLGDFELQIRVDYTYRSPSAMKLAAEVASKLGGNTSDKR